MPLQTVVNFVTGIGVPGEILFDGPKRVYPYTLISTPQLNIVGATAYTVVSDGVAMAGGSGAFAGILVNPKTYPLFGGVPFNPSLTLPDNTIGELLVMGTPLMKLATTANIGDFVVYDATTGALSTVPATGVVTASFATSVMTVTATAIVLGAGQTLNFAGVPPTTQILSQASGTTGGVGTYNLSTTPGTVASAAGNVLAGSFAGAGKVQIPRARVILKAVTVAGLGIIELTD